MARLIMFSEYIKDNAHKKNSIEYIAKRDGSTLNIKNTTPSQLAFLNAIINSKHGPQIKELSEYKKWDAEKTKVNASELLTQALEFIEPGEIHNQTYLNYISERTGSHGLFNSEGTADLKLETKNMKEFKGTVYNHVFSLRKEDAEQLGYDSPEKWQELLTQRMPEIAQAMKIDLNDLKWNAAYHDNTKYPHVHVQVYSKSNKAFLNKDAITRIRSLMTNEIFKEEMAVYKTDFIDSKKMLHQEFSKLFTSNIEDPTDKALNNKMLALNELLEQQSGRKAYGYLEETIKKEVDSIAYMFLKQNKYLETVFDKHTAAHEAMFQMYNVNKKDYYSYEMMHPKKKNDTFLHNVIIKNALDNKSKLQNNVEELGEMFSKKGWGKFKENNIYMKNCILGVYNQEKDMLYGYGSFHNILQIYKNNNYEENNEINEEMRNLIDTLCETDTNFKAALEYNANLLLMSAYSKEKPGITFKEYQEKKYDETFYNPILTRYIKKGAFELNKYKQLFDYDKHYVNVELNLQEMNLDNINLFKDYDRIFDSFNTRSKNMVTYKERPMFGTNNKIKYDISGYLSVRSNVSTLFKMEVLAKKTNFDDLEKLIESHGFTKEQSYGMLKHSSENLTRIENETLSFSNQLRLGAYDQKKIKSLTGYKFKNLAPGEKAKNYIENMRDIVLKKYWDEVLNRTTNKHLTSLKEQYIQNEYDKDDFIDAKVADIIKHCYISDAEFKDNVDKYVRKRMNFEFQGLYTEEHFRDFYIKNFDKYVNKFLNGDLSERVHNYVFKAANELRILQKKFDYDKHAEYVSEFLDKIDWQQYDITKKVAVVNPKEEVEVFTKEKCEDLLADFLDNQRVNPLATNQQEKHFVLKEFQIVRGNLTDVFKASVVARDPNKVNLEYLLRNTKYTQSQKESMINDVYKKLAEMKAETEKFGNQLRLSSFETSKIEDISGVKFYEEVDFTKFKVGYALAQFCFSLSRLLQEESNQLSQQQNRLNHKKKIKRKLGLKLAGRSRYYGPSISR